MSQKSASEVLATLQDIGTCMFTTLDHHKRIVSRPMGLAHIDEDDHLWFFTSVESEKVDDVVGEGQVNLAFVDHKTWISVTGTAELVTDQQKKQELEDLGVKAYFADGPEDPEAALLRIEPENAQYWEGPGRVTAFVKLVRSSLNSTAPDMGEQGRVNL